MVNISSPKDFSYFIAVLTKMRVAISYEASSVNADRLCNTRVPAQHPPIKSQQSLTPRLHNPSLLRLLANKSHSLMTQLASNHYHSKPVAFLLSFFLSSNGKHQRCSKRAIVHCSPLWALFMLDRNYQSLDKQQWATILRLCFHNSDYACPVCANERMLIMFVGRFISFFSSLFLSISPCRRRLAYGW